MSVINFVYIRSGLYRVTFDGESVGTIVRLLREWTFAPGSSSLVVDYLVANMATTFSTLTEAKHIIRIWLYRYQQLKESNYKNDKLPS